MSTEESDVTRKLYRWAVWLLIVTSVATMVGRIAAVRAATGETPMLSANDRSRWCTIRTLVEDGSYVIDPLEQVKHPETGRRFWRSIDMVRHRGPDGKEHYYSSKPTLLPTMIAGEYWLIYRTTGASLGEHPFLVMRLMLVITNVLPLLIYFIVLWKLIDRLTSDRMVAVYTMAAATWGTFLTTFAVTLNNHLIAAIAVLVAVALTLLIWWGERSWWAFFGAGLAATFAVANELPALSFFACICLAMVWKSPRQTILGYVPGVLLVAAGFFGTNYLAHGTWTPAYMHRSDGPLVATIDDSLAGELDEKLAATEKGEVKASEFGALGQALGQADVQLSDRALVLKDTPHERWVVWDSDGHKRFALVHADDQIEVHRWDNWYDYRGSYWKTDRQGVDKGEESRGRYAFHSLIGHRGVFSLTPIWILAAFGVISLVARGRPGWVIFGWMVIALTVVCMAFYISRPVIDRNYGGVCCGFRWMFWFTPLWLLCMVPAAQWLLRRSWGRVVALVLLLASVFSATYAGANPWSQPWLFNLGTYFGWWSY